MPNASLLPLAASPTYTEYLATATLAPGIFAAVLVVCAGVCAHRTTQKRTAGSMCTKTLVGVSDLVLLGCLVFYGLFACVGIAMAQPRMINALARVSNVCDASLPGLKQAVVDAEAAAVNAEFAGVAIGEVLAYIEAIDLAVNAYDLYNGSCRCYRELFIELRGLAPPAILCVAACLFALLCLNSMCCAADGCRGIEAHCPKPPKMPALPRGRKKGGGGAGDAEANKAEDGEAAQLV